MSLILFTTTGCYPCDRAKINLINSGLTFEVDKSNFNDFPIAYYPTLVLLDDNNCWASSLVGHQINRQNLKELTKASCAKEAIDLMDKIRYNN